MLIPLIAAILSWFIANQHAEFWATANNNVEDDANRNAAVMLALSQGFQTFLCVVLGCIVGLFFAVLSLTIQRTKLGFFGLVLNLSPFVLLIFMKA
ncbi:MAG: hypothetical protein ACRD82_21680 [Blastocatellia bacterium]